MAAALPFKMGPGTHQPAALVGQGREFHLQAALASARASAEDLQDQSGSVDDLALPGALKIALLDRRQLRIDDSNDDVLSLDNRLDRVDLAGAKQGRRPGRTQRRDAAFNNIDRNGLCEANGFFEPCFRGARNLCARPRQRQDDDGFVARRRPRG